MAKVPKKAIAAVAAVALSISALIKPWEGLSLTSYPDIVGVWTACYGETKDIRPGMKFSKAELIEPPIVKSAAGMRAPRPAMLMIEPWLFLSAGQIALLSRTAPKNFKAKPLAQSASES